VGADALPEAVDTMLARCEHDVLDLYRSTDPVYVRYRSQVVTFAHTVGAKLGWDHTLMNANTWRKRTDFTDRVKMLIREA
jgi:hypothetical protein